MLRWPAHPPLPIGSDHWHTYVRLLDEDDDLAGVIETRSRDHARASVTARAVEVESGDLAAAGWADAVGLGPGLLILDGLVASETSVAERTATELLGAGDLLQPIASYGEDFVVHGGAWRVLTPTRLAILDQPFLERVQPWPQVLMGILRPVGRRCANRDLLRAIVSHPRLEERLVLLVWHLASRWGRVEPGGIRLSLPLTHRLLGQIVAAERPSISHALTRLAHAGLVTGSAGDLHLHGDLDHHLQVLAERHPRCEEPVGHPAPGRASAHAVGARGLSSG